MKTIVFADRSMPSHAADAQEVAVALQPVADKTVIEYTLEELADAGMGEVIVVAAPDMANMRDLLGGGERWGLNIRIVTSRGNEHPGLVLPRLGLNAQTPLLALRGDELRSRSVAAFLKLSDMSASAVHHATDSEGRVLMTTALAHVNLDGLDRSVSSPVPPAKGEHVSLEKVQCRVIDSLASLGQANLELLNGAFSDQLVPGLQYGEYLRRGRLADVDSVQVDAPAYVGDHARMHPTAHVTGTTVIGAKAFIDEGTQLHNCVVMPGTYIGANLVLRDAVVTSSGIYQTRRDQHTPVNEPLWVDAAVKREAGMTTAWFERFTALLLALLTAPVVAAGLILAAISGRGHPQFTSLPSNRLARNGTAQRCHVLCLGGQAGRIESLARLWLVVAGHRRLLGVTDADAEVVENWEYSLRQLPRGVFPGARWMLSGSAPREEQLLAETILATRSLAGQLALILGSIWRRATQDGLFSQPRQA